MSLDPQGELAKAGAVRVRHALCHAETDALATLLADVDPTAPGVRLHDRPGLTRALSPDGAIGRTVATVAGDGYRPVRAVIFDKSRANNWSLGWHQDRVIAVKARSPQPGFGPWSIKAGVQHVAPPFDLLRRMVTVRVHLDPVDETNAPLLVALGTHDRLHGVAHVAAAVSEAPQLACLADAGDIWIYATPILHASAAATTPRRRRVLQIDFSRDDLPGALDWYGV
ncbi:MAG: phytanoyl-CoA dioxygenase [Brevundimonas sp.]|nr:MAG: phytanoyl-CoA dioxygenase [Brevundimonas sp.]